jgi:crotonobetainyl-CoA:carnitine CoA-transferase CaiB-like acyl-CoA transferase
MPETDARGMLDGIRVLDLALPYGQYCGRLLADLGADVIKLEPPEGDPARRLGPFKGDKPDAERSLVFASYNTNKRSLVLDRSSAAGQETFRRLVASVDAIIETPAPGEGLDFAELRRLNPRLILASISGFRAGGPYERFRATSRVVFALSGIMKNIGPEEGPPEAAPGQIAFDLAAIDAASGIACSLIARGTTGRGQHVTVAAHEVLVAEINPRPANQFDDRRHPGSANPQLAPSGSFTCRDGTVVMFVNLPGHWDGLMELIGHPEELAGEEWKDRGYRHQHADEVYRVVASRLADMPLAQVVAEGQRLHVPCGPVNSLADFAKDAHMAARGFFREVSSPTLGSCKMPGPPYKLSEPAWAIRRPAPRLGEHTEEILQQLHEARLGSQDPRPRTQEAALPLAGIRVVGFTTAFAGPTVARYLADLGAEVIKVESRRRWDNTRHASSAGTGGYVEPGGAPTAPGFGYFNRNQLGIAIDLSQARGQELMRRLIAKTDVIVENFSLQVLRKWGFSYPELKAIRDDIILLDMQGFGQTGPLKDYISFGSIIHAYSGLASLWGAAHGFFVDYVAAQHAVFGVLASLLHRGRTGRGMHLDLAQLETAGASLGVQYLDYFVNGYVQSHGDGRMLNDAPAGCYPCQGRDRWCVIEVTNDDDWRRLREVLGAPGWALDQRLDTAAGRLAHRLELDQRLAEWTRQHADREVQELLQAAGVPAAVVCGGGDVFEDAHLAATGFYWTIDQQALGPWKYPRQTIRLSDMPEMTPRPAPMLGEHNDYVFGELLGLPAHERAELAAAGVLA